MMMSPDAIPSTRDSSTFRRMAIVAAVVPPASYAVMFAFETSPLAEQIGTFGLASLPIFWLISIAFFISRRKRDSRTKDDRVAFCLSLFGASWPVLELFHLYYLFTSRFGGMR